jgi:hypothetical protein
MTWGGARRPSPPAGEMARVRVYAPSMARPKDRVIPPRLPADLASQPDLRLTEDSDFLE